MPTDHAFRAVAFPENLALKDLSRAYPEARAHGARELGLALGRGTAHFYPFGAVTFQDVDRETQGAEVTRLRAQVPGLSAPVADEEFVVREGENAGPRVEAGTLTIERMTEARAEV